MEMLLERHKRMAAWFAQKTQEAEPVFHLQEAMQEEDAFMQNVRGISEPTIADAILDQIVHTAHRIELKGDSLRKKSVALSGSLVLAGSLTGGAVSPKWWGNITEISNDKF